MKRNMLQTMDKLDIDEEARPLIRQMWKHGYRTLYGCAGHEARLLQRQWKNPRTGGVRKYWDMEGDKKYISYEEGTGDGWFEKNAKELGFVKRSKGKVIDPRKRNGSHEVNAISYYGKEKYFDGDRNKGLQIILNSGMRITFS